MKLISTIQLGKFNTYKIETEGDNLFEAVYQLGGIHSISKCGLCGGDYLSLKAMKTEGDFEYLKVVCGKCGGAVTFGKTKKDGIMYYRRNDEGKLDWQKYEKKTSASNNNAHSEIENPPVDPEENNPLPF